MTKPLRRATADMITPAEAIASRTPMQSAADPSPLRRRVRLHAIDWLRVLAMVVVFFQHVTHIFDYDTGGSLRNAETSLAASIFFFFAMQWTMPLFFLMAGASSWFSLRSRTAASYLRERAHRLLVPLFFGTIVLIPWNGYLSALNRGTFDGSFLAYIPVHFERTWLALTRPEVYHGPVALYHTSWHLWFLGYLMLFSAVSLLWSHREASMRGLAAMCDRPAGLLMLGVPIVLIRLALGAGFPAYVDWTDTLVFLVAFFYGWLFMTDERFLRAVERQTRVWLAVGCVSFAVTLGTHAAGYLLEWLARPRYSFDYLFYQALSGINTWAWVLAIIGCGLRWLNFENAFLRYAGGAVLPFYMLHQVVNFTVAETVVQWRAGVWLKMLVISIIAFAVTMSIYELLIRRASALRPLFGLKSDVTAT